MIEMTLKYVLLAKRGERLRKAMNIHSQSRNRSKGKRSLGQAIAQRCAVRRLSGPHCQVLGIVLELFVAHVRECSKLKRQRESVDFALVLSQLGPEPLLCQALLPV